MTYDDKERSTYQGQPVECFLFAVGGTEYRYTSADQEVALWAGDPNYTPVAITSAPVDWDAEDRSGTMDVTLPSTDPMVAMFVPYVPADPVALTIYRKHRDDAEVITAWTGRVSAVRFENGLCVMTCAPLRSLLRRRVPRITYQGPCNWALYSPRCGVDKLAFRDTGVISGITGDQVSAATFATRADGWYSNGWVELTNGDRRFIVDHVGDTLTLLAPLFGAVPGDTIHAFAGCNRSETECSTKFANLANHLGFPRVPSRNPYTSGIV